MKSNSLASLDKLLSALPPGYLLSKRKIKNLSGYRLLVADAPSCGDVDSKYIQVMYSPLENKLSIKGGKSPECSSEYSAVPSGLMEYLKSSFCGHKLYEIHSPQSKTRAVFYDVSEDSLSRAIPPQNMQAVCAIIGLLPSEYRVKQYKLEINENSIEFVFKDDFLRSVEYDMKKGTLQVKTRPNGDNSGFCDFKARLELLQFNLSRSGEEPVYSCKMPLTNLLSYTQEQIVKK